MEWIATVEWMWRFMEVRSKSEGRLLSDLSTCILKSFLKTFTVYACIPKLYTLLFCVLLSDIFYLCSIYSATFLSTSTVCDTYMFICVATVHLFSLCIVFCYTNITHLFLHSLNGYCGHFFLLQIMPLCNML